jgi:hypothetical protein
MTAKRLRWLRALARTTVVASAALHMSVSLVYQDMTPDGISYLDIADAYMRRDWHTAINSVWSPLYSWLLGPILASVPRSIYWEFRVVHLVNFGIFVVTFTAFEFFWTQLTAYARAGTTTGAAGNNITLPSWAWHLLGYALFAWHSLVLTNVAGVTPDLLMASLVYVAAGLLVRTRVGHTEPRDFVWLGTTLGLAYLSKSVMLPLGVIALGIAVSALRRPRRMLSSGLLAVVAFLVVSGPFIMLISLAKGRLTFGDAGRLTYVRLVNQVPYPHWQGSPENGQVLVHPSRKILDTPPVYEFATPIRSTYPISYDPSYWYEGVRPRVDWAEQSRVIRSNLIWYAEFFLRGQAPLLVCVGLMYWMGRRRLFNALDILRNWGLATLAGAALAMYALVLVENRYIAVFIILLWGDLLANVRLANTVDKRRWAGVLSGILLTWLLLVVGASNVKAAQALGIFLRSSDRSSLLAVWPTEVAQELDRLGVRAGSPVAVIGYGFSSYWARLARVQIVAEMFGWQSESFWKDSSTRTEVFRAFASCGAVAIVAEDVFTEGPLATWHRVGQSHYYIYLLDQPTAFSVLPACR